jgi:hypothetical protein
LRCLLAVGLAFYCVGSVAIPLGHAAPLRDAACKNLDAQQRILETQGLKEEVAKGPDWAKANLSTSRLALIKHYIYVKEQVAFRCPSLTIAAAPELAEPEAAQPLAKETGKAAGKSKKKTKKQKKSASGAVPAPPEKAAATQ